MNILNTVNFDEFNAISEKSSGREKGGIFEKDGVKYMIKDMDMRSVMAEYVGSNIANYLLPGLAPEVFLVKNGTNIYAASKFLDNFKPLQVYINDGVYNSMDIHGEDKRDTVINFVSHGDMHNGNLGVIENGKNFKAAVVDFSRSLTAVSKAVIDHKYWSLAFMSKFTYSRITELIEEMVIAANKPEFKDLLENMLVTIDATFDPRDNMLQYYKNQYKNIFSTHLIACQKELSLAKILSHNVLSYDLLSHDFLSDNCLTSEFGGYMSGILIKQAWNDDDQHFSQSLQKLSNCPGLMHDAFDLLLRATARDVKHYLDEMFVYIQPYLQHSNPLIESTLKYSVKGDHKEYFEKILPYIAQSPALIKSTFEVSMLHDKIEYFEKILPHIIKFPDVMKKAFEDSLQNNKIKHFEKMLPYMMQFSNVMKKAFVDSLQNDKIEYFEKMLPYMMQFSDVMKQVFETSLQNDKIEHFDKLLPFQSCQSIDSALDYVLKFNQIKHLESILPYTLQSPKLLVKALLSPHTQPDAQVVIQDFIKICKIVGNNVQGFLPDDQNYCTEEFNDYENLLVGEIDPCLV